MKFTITFTKLRGSSTDAISIESIPVGYKLFIWARKELKDRENIKLNIEDVEDTVKMIRGDVFVNVDEIDIPLFSPYFDNTNNIKVYVPPKYLNKYVLFDLKYEIHKYKKYNWLPLYIKKVNKCVVYYKIDKNRIILDWISAKTPLKWVIEKEEEPNSMIKEYI